jgi:fibronectin-binding autotransporter adhesin
MVINYPRDCAKRIMKTTLKTSIFQIQICLVLAALFSAPATAPAAQAVWQAIVNTSTDTNWSDSANWQSGTLPSGNNCVFNDATGVGNNSTINNVVDTSEFPLSLLYTNIGTFQNTLILPGATLTIGAGGLMMTNAAGQLTNPPVTVTTISGSTLMASNDSVLVQYAFDTTSRTGPTLNMSGLANFIGTNMVHMYAGVGAVRLSGILYLAATNNIYFTGASSPSSPNMEIGFNSGNNGPPSFLYLGETNLFYVNDIGIGLEKQNGSEIEFNSAFNNPSVYFYGTNGPGSLVSTWAIADGEATGGTTTTAGTADFTGGSVHANVNNLRVGRSSSAENGGSPVDNGTLTFAAGEITANNMTNGWITSAAENTTAEATINVNGTAVLNVNNNLVLATTNTGLTYTTHTVEAQAELFIAGGTVLANNILTGGMGNSGGGYGAYIQMTGGLLAVTNTMGSATYPINYLILGSSATLQFSVNNNVTNAQIQNLSSSDSSTSTINISSLPVVPRYPSLYPILAYQGGSGNGMTFSLGTMPGTYTGYVSNDNSSTVWLVVTNGPAAPILDQWGGAVSDNWDTTTKNWTNSGVAVAYIENDSVLFSDQAQTGTVNLTAPHTPFTWAISNNVLNYTLTGSGVEGDVELVKSGTASATLTESGDSFLGGISVLGGTLVLDQSSSSVAGGLSIAAGATTQIGNNDANGALPAGTLLNSGTLAWDQSVYALFSTSLSGGGGLTQEGSGTLALTVANTYTGNTLVSKGTLALTNSGSISDSAAVTVNNATLDVSAESANALNSLNLANASLNVSVPYVSAPVSVSALTLGGTGNTINIASLPPIAAYPATITLIQSASAVSGSDVSLGTVPTASPAYAGSVSVSGNQVVLTLTAGPIGVRPYVTWVGVDALGSVSTNWTDNTNWLTPVAPSAGDNVIFNETAAQNASALSAPGGGPTALVPANENNIVNASTTISSLNYTNVGGTYQNTFIASGKSLTITNNIGTNVILAIGSSSTDFGASATENATISGPNGALNVDNTNDTIFVGMVTGGAGTEQGTLDMSGLGSFNASVSSFAVGAVNSTAVGTIATAYLAQNNIITAGGGTNLEASQNENLSFMVGETGKNGAGTCYLYLGQQNTINANYIGVSIAKEPAVMEFNPVWSTPSATFRAADGVSAVAVWAIGDALAQTGGSTKPIGIVDFTGGTVNALVNTMYIGRSPNASGPNPATGTLNFGAGTFAATTVYDGYQAFGTSDNGVGTINVSGSGLLQISTLNLALTTSGESSPTTGALNITNGTADLGTVVCDSHAAGQSTINLVSGTLEITGTAGVTGAPLTALDLTGGTLELEVNGAANATNIVANAVTTSGTTALSIVSLSGVTTGVTYPLIAYTGTDPFSSLSLSPLPAGYAGTLVDGPGVVGLQLTVAPPLSPPRFTRISVSGSTLNIAGTNGVASGAFILLETTNIAPPVHWTPALTNSYNVNGAFNLSTNILNPATPDEFFTLTNVP